MARVALARRDILLRAHRHRLRIEDLEDCYSQATLELIQRAQTGAPFANAAHVAHSVEQKFLSRIHDRRRALAGRSPIEAALGQAAALEPPDGGGQFADPGPSVVEQVAIRAELAVLREIARELTPDMRLVISHQVGLGTECQDFCHRYGWSPEKFRKVAQRARQKLWALSEEYAVGDRCRRLEPDLLAFTSRVAGEDERRRAQMHLDNCAACRRRVRDLRAQERGLLGLLPGGLEAGAIGLAGGAAGSAAAGGGAVAAGSGFVAWSSGGLIATKLGVVAICLASLAGGGYALCRDGQLAGTGRHHSAHRPQVRHVAARQVPRRAGPATRDALPVVATAASREPATAASPTGSRTVSQLNKTGSARLAEAPAAREFGFTVLAGVEAPRAQVGAQVATVRHTAKPRRHRRPRRHREFVPVITSTARAAPASTAAPPSAAPPNLPAPASPPPSRPRAGPTGSSSGDGEFGFETG